MFCRGCQGVTKHWWRCRMMWQSYWDQQHVIMPTPRFVCLCVYVCVHAMIWRSLFSQMSEFALVGGWWKWRLQKGQLTRVYLACVWTYVGVNIYIERSCVTFPVCVCVRVCVGNSWANPVCAEFHWSRTSPADCSGRLSKPTHGESLCVLCLKESTQILKVPSRHVWKSIKNCFE